VLDGEPGVIASISGKVINLEAHSVVVDVGGIGFSVNIPAPLQDHLRRGETITLFTYLVVRQDALSLYGFDQAEERDFFVLLIGVDGIGPRLALAVLSNLTTDAIRRAVFNEQSEVFSRVPGVGKKTAQKMLFYLQDKITTQEGLAPIAVMTDVDTEVLDALTTLGYSVVEAQAALQAIPRDAPQEVEERLRLALQYFSS
jgi:Holliday junction DNA helicase RuvA